ncbi:hypothetical protein G033_06015, partial [Pectobacterium peruviense]
ERILGKSTELLRVMRVGHENVDEFTGGFTWPDPGADARSGESGSTGKITDAAGKGLPPSGKRKAAKIRKSL